MVKAWPAFELLPTEALRALFIKDIAGYHMPADRFYPRPRAILADADPANGRWGLVMEDADGFAEHKVHEAELDVDDVMRMIPKLVDVAVAWEGCDRGAKADELDAMGVGLWAAEPNLQLYKSVMPGGAKLFDRVTSMADSTLVDGRRWDDELGPGICELFTTRLDAFFASAHPANGATCTLSHGDLRGDNIFFCSPSERHPDGWLCIDFQLMFRGPVPSDLAYLMGTGSVLPDVYAGANLDRSCGRSTRRSWPGRSSIPTTPSSSSAPSTRPCRRRTSSTPSDGRGDLPGGSGQRASSAMSSSVAPAPPRPT